MGEKQPSIPKPPKPPIPPPAPQFIDLMELLNSFYPQNSIINRTRPSFSNDQILSYFFSNSKCKKFTSENFLAYKSSRQRTIYNNSSNTRFFNFNSTIISNQTSTHTTKFIKKALSYSTETSYFNRNDTYNINLSHSVFSNSTFYLINLFLLSICLISIILFIVMISMITKRVNKTKKRISNGSSSSASSSSSSISFVACYSTSLNSSLHSSVKALEKNKPHGISIQNLVEISDLQWNLKKSELFKTDQILKNKSPAKKSTEYYTIGDNAYSDSNFQLKAKPVTDLNEYYVIPDLESVQIDRNYNLMRDSISTIPLNRDLSGFSEYYCLDKDNRIELNPTYLENFNRELESYYAYFDGYQNDLNSGKKSSTRIFPRTNPMCRNANYYGKICTSNKKELAEKNDAFTSKL